MSLIKFDNIGIKAIAACVPSRIEKTINQTKFFDIKKLESFIDMTGIEERRISGTNITSSDLCYQASKKLLNGLTIDKKDISCLIFISQTPDYRMPNTANILQDRLGLNKDIFTLDINQACSGYIWGLIVAYNLCNSGFDNILLCVGDTPSKILSERDSSTSLMFGDCGTATIINKNSKYDSSYFSFNSDGSYAKTVCIPSGGFRNPTSIESLKYKMDNDGNEKNEEQIHMDGLEVFSVSVSVMVKDIKKILNYANIGIDDIDKFVLHQANLYMNNIISKKINVDPAKNLISIRKFGNTSSTSIPLNIAFNKSKVNSDDKLLFEAIGASFTWGSAILKLNDFENFGVFDYIENDFS